MLYETSGDGGIDASLEDMILWLRHYRAEHRFGPHYRARMEQEVSFGNGRTSPYRLGVTVMTHRGLAKISHNGGMPGYVADLCFYPELDLGVVVLSNLIDPKIFDLPDRIADFFRDAPPPAELAPDFAGRTLYLRVAGHGAPHRRGGRPDGVLHDGRPALCWRAGHRRANRPLKRGVEYTIRRASDDTIEVTFGAGMPMSVPASRASGKALRAGLPRNLSQRRAGRGASCAPFTRRHAWRRVAGHAAAAGLGGSCAGGHGCLRGANAQRTHAVEPDGSLHSRSHGPRRRLPLHDPSAAARFSSKGSPDERAAGFTAGRGALSQRAGVGQSWLPAVRQSRPLAG